MFFAYDGAGATAAIIRDERGTFLAGYCRYIPFAADAVTTEAMAMRDGLGFANSLGFHGVEAETDSQEVINFCTGHNTWWDPAAAIFADVLTLEYQLGRSIICIVFDM